MHYRTKNIVKKFIWPFSLLYKLFICKESYLKVTGWLKSFRKSCPCKPDGTVLPWMNYSIINLLEKRLNKEMDMFEYGSGFSTFFYAKLVKTVTSLEYDRYWFNNSIAKDLDNVTLLFQEVDTDGTYCRKIIEQKKNYDVVIVDGRDRVNCFKQSVDALSASGVIILDDSQRERYAEAYTYAEQKGFRHLEFQGLKPHGTKLDRTTIFYRPNNCFNI